MKNHLGLCAKCGKIFSTKQFKNAKGKMVFKRLCSKCTNEIKKKYMKKKETKEEEKTSWKLKLMNKILTRNIRKHAKANTKICNIYPSELSYEFRTAKVPMAFDWKKHTTVILRKFSREVSEADIVLLNYSSLSGSVQFIKVVKNRNGYKNMVFETMEEIKDFDYLPFEEVPF